MSLRAIARELGVSSTAVSLALKNSPRVSEVLRRRVARLAARDHYVPNARLAELMAEVRLTTPKTYRATLAMISLYPEKDPATVARHLPAFVRGAADSARKHGYGLAPFWLCEPGMTPARLAGILAARGIRGVLCLGSKDPDAGFPAELQDFAVVTFGTSIPGKLHRITSHFSVDCEALMRQLLERGYRRPGLIIAPSGDRRSGFVYSSVFLGVQERCFAAPAPPILRLESWEPRKLDAWLAAHQPDVLVLHEHLALVVALEKHLLGRGIAIPRDLGIALLDLNPDRTRFAGICQNFELMGATALEMLIGRVLLRDFVVPEHPKIELVIGDWNEGQTLRPLPRAAAGPGLRR